jgi:hypothetical protein
MAKQTNVWMNVQMYRGLVDRLINGNMDEQTYDRQADAWIDKHMDRWMTDA